MRPRRVSFCLALFVFASPLFAGYRISSWIPGWDANALSSTQLHAGVMSESNPTWYNFNTDGTLAKKTAAEDPTWRAAMTGTALMPTIQNTTPSGFSQTLAVQVLSTATTRETHAEEIRTLVRNQAYDGIDIDYERLPQTSRANFTAFVQLLASKLHADGKKLSVTLYAKTSDTDTWDGPGGEDYAAIGAVADWVKLMIYDYSWSTSAAGPITPLSWLDQVLAFAQAQMPASKIMVGLPWYGYDWVGTSGADVTYAQATGNANTNGVLVGHDVNGEATYRYSTHTVYFVDSFAHDKKVDLVLQKYAGVAGFCYWRNGSEDPAVWTRVAALFGSTTTPPPPPPPAPAPTLPPANAVSGRTLIPTGATWRYLDNGSNQGSAWTPASFNDGAWKTGAAQLGYGDGDERTVVSFGPSSSAKYTTTYFRYAFDLADPSAYTSLALQLRRDDGAVVYLNGTEVYRSSMPAGAIAYNTFALACSDDGATWYSAAISAALLVAGRNAIAVEVHQADPSSSDISFDFGLTATLQPPPAPSALQAAVVSSSAINLAWTDNSANEDGFKVERCTGTQAACDASPAAFTQIAQLGANMTSYSAAALAGSTTYTFRVRAFNGDGNSAYPPSAAATTPAAPAPVNAALVAFGSSWKFLDNGTDQGTAWRSLSFSDTAWKSGLGQLGYGDGDERTVVSYGASSRNKFITTYFRRQFTVSDPAAFSSLLVRLVRDDGAVVYVNGLEVWRSNMPAGAITYLTKSATGVAGSDESKIWEATISPSMLVPGTNVIAVEIHQDAANSSDISFDLALIGN